MKKVFIVAAAIVMAGAFAGTRAAADKDSDVLNSFMSSPFAQGGQAAGQADRAGVRTPAADPTLVLHQTVVAWDDLRPETREALSSYIEIGPWRNGARSINLLDPDIGCKSAISEESNQHFDSTHFRIIYTTSGEHAATVDYVTAMAQEAETIYAKEVGQMGFTYAVTSAETEPEKYRIYVCDLMGSMQNTLGLTFPDFVLTDNTAQTHIDMDNDYAEANTRESVTLAQYAGNILAHEYFHAIQMATIYSGPSLWLMESTATWMEDEVYPDINDYIYEYLGLRFQNLHRSIDYFDQNDPLLLGYGASIFIRYITEKVANSSFVYTVFDTMKTTCVGTPPPETWCSADVTETPFFNTYLNTNYSKDFPTVYRDFNVANYSKNYSDGASVDFPNVTTTNLALSSGFTTKTENGSLDHLGAKFYAFTFPAGMTGNVTINFSGAATASDWRVSLVKKTGEGQYSTSNMTVNSGTGSLVMTGFGTTFTEGAIIVNNTHLASDAKAYTLTLTRQQGGGGTLIGDVDASGGVDGYDAVLVLRHDVGLTTLEGDALTAADTDHSGGVDGYDAVLILRCDVSLISCDF